jgi:capsular polysaccharide biosynthesis protein
VRPEEYALIVLRRWWLVALAALVAAGVAFTYSNAQPRTYQVSTRLMAIAEPPDYWLDLYAKNRLGSYKGMINNGDFVADALARAGLQVDLGQAMSTLSVDSNNDGNLVQITVTDTDPERAAAVANALADAFVVRSEAENQRIAEAYPSGPEGDKRGTVEVVKLETASPPQNPIGPRVKLNTAAAALLGLAFGVLLTFGAAYLDDTLRTVDDIDRYLALPTIVEVPRA